MLRQMAITTPAADRARAERSAKRLLLVGLAPVIPGMVLIVWLIGFGAHPHQAGFACVLAIAAGVIVSGGQWWMYRVRMKQARRLTADS
jgi:hypothetical protein